jgi:hypothetical protein
MTTATTDSMNFLLQKNEERINAKIPKLMFDKVEQQCSKLRISKSLYLKMALQEKLDRDMNK